MSLPRLCNENTFVYVPQNRKLYFANVWPESLYKGPGVAGVVHGVDTLVGEVAHPASAVNVVLDILSCISHI